MIVWLIIVLEALLGMATSEDKLKPTFIKASSTLLSGNQDERFRRRCVLLAGCCWSE